jgi:hypothetical protein
MQSFPFPSSINRKGKSCRGLVQEFLGNNFDFKRDLLRFDACFRRFGGSGGKMP